MCEMPSVYDFETRKARKEHKCCECNQTIEKGESYNYHHGIWDHRAMSFKVCLGCDDFRDEENVHYRYDEKICFEGVYDHWTQLDKNQGKTRDDFKREMMDRRPAKRERGEG